MSTSSRHPAVAPDPLVSVLSAALGLDPSDTDVVDTVSTQRLDEIARLLHYRIATIYEHDEAERCRTMLDDLSEVSASRLLRSPALCQIVRLDIRGGGLKSLLQSEWAVERKLHENAWCSMGTVWLGREPPPGDIPIRYEDGRFHGPRLACGIPLDCSLGPVLEYPSAGLESPRCLDRAETRDAILSLDSAVRILEEVYPIGHAVFADLTSNIVLRGDSARCDSWGATSGIAIGRILIANPAAAGGAHLLADILLHEATHCAIACAELKAPLLQPEVETDAPFIASPWSGAPLSPRVLVHACAVWAILLRYWDRYLECHDGDAAIHARYRYIRHGFDRLDWKRLLEPVAGCLTESAMWLVKAACDSYRASRP